MTLSEYVVFVAAHPRSIRIVVYASQSGLFGVSLFPFLATVVVAVIAHCSIDSGRSNPLAVNVAQAPIVCVENNPPTDRPQPGEQLWAEVKVWSWSRAMVWDETDRLLEGMVGEEAEEVDGTASLRRDL
jgi:hypothetical protein